MALSFNGSSSGLAYSGASFVDDYPFTIFVWTKVSTTQNGFALELALDPTPRTAVHQGHGLVQSWGSMAALSTASGLAGSTSAYSSIGVSPNVWVPAMVVFTSSNLRKIYYGNGSVKTSPVPVSQVPSVLTAFSVGKMAVQNTQYWLGDLACVGIWSSELTAADFAALSAGAVPSTVQSADLVEYWSLTAQAASQTGLNGRVLVATDTAQAPTHPIIENVDATAPTFSGTLSVSALTATSYTLAWPAASDNVGVASYERSLDGGGTWVDVGNVLTVNISGRSPGTTDLVRVRARDAAGNRSAALATTVVLPADTTAPTMSGSIAVSNITSSSYTLAWAAATDNVGVTAYEVSVDGGATYSSAGNVLTVGVSGRTAGTTDAVRVRARDAAGNASAPLSASVTLQSTADLTPPTLTGVITVSNLSSTGYTLSWSAGSDNVAVTSYERSLDGGGTWLDVGNVLTVTITGRAAGTTDAVRVRAKDGAGNVSTALATTINLPASGTPTLTTPPMKNNTGTLLANLSGITVNVYNASTGVLVLRKTGLSSNGAGVVSISDASLVAGTTYAYEVVTAASGRRLPTGLAA